MLLWEHIYTLHLLLRERHMVVPDEGREVVCRWGYCAVENSIAEMLPHWQAAHKQEAQNEAHGDPHGRCSCKRRACQQKARRGIPGTRLQVSNFPKHMRLCTTNRKSGRRDARSAEISLGRIQGATVTTFGIAW